MHIDQTASRLARLGLSRRDMLGGAALAAMALVSRHALGAAEVATTTAAGNLADSFVRVSPRDARYFELSNGQPYIPIGVNLAVIGGRPSDEAAGLAIVDDWFQKLSRYGGNFARVWIGAEFFDVEHERSGEYDPARAKRIGAMLALARRHGIRVKLCIEYFRTLNPNSSQKWTMKPLHRIDHGGPARDMDDFYTSDRCREQFKRKLAWFQERIGSDPTIFGWELWNEINAVSAKQTSYMPWTQEMLGELHRLFPRNLAVQSLGSFDRETTRDLYRSMCTMAGNDVAQVHRYLDQGAKLDICRGPMDLLASAAVREVRDFDPRRPVLLAESGAVQPSHSGPSRLYEKDKAGMLLHDVLFAPFFAGAAGTGHCWHWDAYVDRNDLWHCFGRFAAVVKDLDPPAEDFQPSMLAHPRLRVYQLKGRRTRLLWCRDSQNTWQTELEQGRAPDTLTGVNLDLAEAVRGANVAGVQVYDPWQDRWTDAKLDDGALALPAFSRSIVVRLALR